MNASRPWVWLAAIVAGGCWFDLGEVDPGSAPGGGGASSSNVSTVADTVVSSHTSTSSVGVTSSNTTGGGGAGGAGGEGGDGGAGGEWPEPVGEWTSCASLSAPGTCLGAGMYIWQHEWHQHCAVAGPNDTCYVESCNGACIDVPNDGDLCGFKCENTGGPVQTCQAIATAGGGSRVCHNDGAAVLEWTGTDCMLKVCDDELPGASCKPGPEGVVDCYP